MSVLAPTSTPTCPGCGSTDVALDYEAAVTIRFNSDGIGYIVLSAVTDHLPDNINCSDCYADFPGEKVPDQTLADLDRAVDALRLDLRNETSIYSRPVKASN